MPITIAGSGTITGLSQGGLPANSVTAATCNFSPGKILQVKFTEKTNPWTTTQGNSSGYADIDDLTVSITPASTSNKILVAYRVYASGDGQVFYFRLCRGSTFIGGPSGTSSSGANWNANGHMWHDDTFQEVQSFQYLDSPSTTSSTTYKVQMAVSGGTGYLNRYTTDNYHGVSSITAMEVAV